MNIIRCDSIKWLSEQTTGSVGNICNIISIK